MYKPIRFMSTAINKAKDSRKGSPLGIFAVQVLCTIPGTVLVSYTTLGREYHAKAEQNKASANLDNLLRNGREQEHNRQMAVISAERQVAINRIKNQSARP